MLGLAVRQRVEAVTGNLGTLLLPHFPLSNQSESVKMPGPKIVGGETLPEHLISPNEYFPHFLSSLLLFKGLISTARIFARCHVCGQILIDAAFCRYRQRTYEEVLRGIIPVVNRPFFSLNEMAGFHIRETYVNLKHLVIEFQVEQAHSFMSIENEYNH